jgi:hypothetical protein
MSFALAQAAWRERVGGYGDNATIGSSPVMAETGLSRDVAFMSSLGARRVPFIVAELGRAASARRLLAGACAAPNPERCQASGRSELRTTTPGTRSGACVAGPI